MGEVITVYIKDKRLISWMNLVIKKGKYRNRSHLIEEAIKKLMIEEGVRY